MTALVSLKAKTVTEVIALANHDDNSSTSRGTNQAHSLTRAAEG